MVKGFIKVWYIRFRVMTACNLPMSMRRLMASSEGGRNWVSERLRLFAWPCLFELGTKLGLNQGVHLPQEIEIVLAYHRRKTLLMQSPSNFEVELLLVRVSEAKDGPLRRVRAQNCEDILPAVHLEAGSRALALPVVGLPCLPCLTLRGSM